MNLSKKMLFNSYICILHQIVSTYFYASFHNFMTDKPLDENDLCFSELKNAFVEHRHCFDSFLNRKCFLTLT